MVFKIDEVDPKKEWINTNLASAYLLSGEYKAAKAIYETYKNKPYLWNDKYETFKEVFLEDLTALEQAGITHKKVKKIRKLLKK